MVHLYYAFRIECVCFFAHLQGFGVADTDNCACPLCCYNVSVNMDKNRSTEIVHNLKVVISIMEIVLMVDYLPYIMLGDVSECIRTGWIF